MMTSRTIKEGHNVRHRSRNWESGEEASFMYSGPNEDRSVRKDRAKVNPLIIPLVYPLLVMFILFQIVLYLDNRLPAAVSISDAVKRKGSAFSAERAMGHLTLLAGIGPRVSGSHENEVVAVDFLMREINWATAYLTAREKDRITIKKQEADGWYYLAFRPHGMMNTYEKLQNIIVRIASKKPSSSSLLINCHFDSVPTSPGASDDGFHCAVMLELIRVLSEEGAPSLPHNIIFLFNGAEESPLQASHAFISQHEWAKEVRAFINLEAAGAGGREILFQAGPGNSWLVNAYADAVPHPYGNVIGEEIFQSGLVPSDTDFRVFRDYGKIPGLDFAHARNGYVYHTKYDDVTRIPLGSMQHTGENLLALIPKIMSSPEFNLNKAKNDSKLTSESANDKAIYFDMMGLYMVNYSEGIGMIFNLFTVFLSVVTIFGEKFGGFSGRLERNVNWKIIVCCGITLMGWLAGALLTVGTAVFLDTIGCRMSWFSRPALIFPLYYCPMLAGCLLPFIFSYQYSSSSSSEKYKAESTYKVYNDSLGVQLIWTAISLAATFLRIRSAFLCSLLVIFPALAHLIVAFCYRLGLYPVQMWLVVRHIFSLIPLAFVFYFGDMCFSLFVPITARIGAKFNPDLLIGIISIIMCLLAFSHVIPLIHLMISPKKIVASVVAIHFIAVLAVVLTPIGFPYGGKPSEPTPQRVQVLHLRSRQHTTVGMEQKNLFWMIDLDRNGAHFSLPKAVEHGCQKMPAEVCEEVLHCGMPVYISRMVDLLPNTHVAPAPEPVIHEPSSLQLVSQKALSTRVRRLTFNITGLKRGSLFLSPAKGVSLKGWVFGVLPNATHFWQGDRPTYYVFHNTGLDSDKPWAVWVDLEVTDDWKNEWVLDVALASHYNHGDPAVRATQAVIENMGPVAPWAHLVAWTATYDGWKF